jgi:hypothetical protein
MLGPVQDTGTEWFKELASIGIEYIINDIISSSGPLYPTKKASRYIIDGEL